MFRKLLVTLTMLFTLPAVASAWYVNAKTSTTGQGTINPAGNSANIAVGVDSGEYTVAPAAGYKISRVTLDGVAISPVNGKYVAPYVAGKAWRYIVAYFTANTVNITTSATGSGAIREDTFESLINIPVGSARQLLIIANPGYQIDSVTAPGATIVDNFGGSKTAVFTNLQADQSVSASFSLIPVVTTSAGRDITIDRPGVVYTANLVGSATSNQGAITYAWSGTGLTFGSVTSATTAVSAAAPGSFIATLKVTSNGIVSTDTATVLVKDGKEYYLNQCVGCHTSCTPTIVSDYTAGAHYTASGHTTGTCQRCHATDGAMVGAAVGWTGSYATLVANQAAVWTPNAPAISAAGVGCVACHNSDVGFGGPGHNTLRSINTYNGAAIAWDPNGNGKSNDQFDVCTSCHSLFDNSGALVGNYHDGSSINTTRTISDSHYDNPATGVGLASTTIEGYAIRAKSASPCADCHNLHTADLTVQEQWAASAHAGRLSTQKEDALCAASIPWFNTTYPTNAAYPVSSCDTVVTIGTRTEAVIGQYSRTTAGIATAKAAGVTGTSGAAWEHYNWDQTTSRGSCQRCHTATGIANFLNNPAAYDATGNGNDFSHLSGWSKATGSPQNELLYCWGCHSNAQNGQLRNPGAITETYAAATTGAPAATVAYPNINQSNVCMGCHLGREIGQTIANDTDADGVRSFINSHYLTAGATIFNESGYEYAGQSYNSFGYHKNVGVANAYNTGTAGPCVTCHMTSGEKHTFIASAESASCANCHGGLTDATLEASKEAFGQALEQLRLALEAKGIYFSANNPYFFTAPWQNYTPPAPNPNVSYTNWAGPYGLAKWKDVMGAAFNYNLLIHDPGAFAHNRGYALKLIQDSIDFITDGVLDGQGVPAAFTTAASNDEFATTTNHTTQTTAVQTAAACATCHSSAPHFGGTVLVKAQYVAPATSVKPAGGSCVDCHNDVAAQNTINLQFAESAHGNPNGEAWWHYDWRSASRAACARCHNSTAYIAKLGIESNVTNIFNNGTDNNLPGEVLACNACHTNVVSGAVRTPGPYTETYADGTGVTLAFPDIGKSNLCMRCHSGRESGGTIAADTDADGVRSFINSHYLTAGGTIFTTTGYEFAGLNYNNVPYYEHDIVGISDSLNPAATDAGPCAACHMGTGTANHTWDVVAKDAQGQITAINSNTCVTCHSGQYEMTPAKLNEEAAGYHAALDALKSALDAKGIYFAPFSPYFYTAPYVVGGTNTAFTNWGPVAASLGLPAVPGFKQVMGAAFNYNLLIHDPGGYAHNSVYSKRLIFDSIDFIKNGVLDGTLDLSASPAAAAYLQGNTDTADDNAVVRP